MGQLDTRGTALGFDKRGDAAQRRNMGVVPQAEIVGRDASFGPYGRGFDDDESRAAHGAASVVHQMPIVGISAFGGVLAHGGYGDPVPEGNGPQCERRKKFGRHDAFG